MSAPQENAYDRTPYQSKSFPSTHPNHLATLARMFGMSPPGVDTCRVLELGCASGGNVMPLAMQFPRSSYLGIDLSERQIATGQASVAELGLINIELRHASITDVDEGWGKFDYILCHGVYSWVPADVQDRLLSVCSKNLAPDGVAVVSYNTNPGWRMRGVIRDAMLYRAKDCSSPEDQVKQARAMIELLAENAFPSEDDSYGAMLRRELEGIRKKEDSYLRHEHLGAINEPLYFHELVERAGAKGLQYLAEAHFSTMFVGDFDAKVAGALRDVAPDVIRKEQYLDFLSNRPFRTTLLVHQEVGLHRDLNGTSLAGLHVESSARRLNPGPDLQSTRAETFESPGGTFLQTSVPLIKAALTVLRERWPQSMHIDELCVAARARLNGVAQGTQAPAVTDMQTLEAELPRCFALDLIGLRVQPFRFADRLGAQPRVSPLARLGARNGTTVTNLRNESLTIEEFTRQLLLQLDGTRDRDTLVAELTARVKARAMGLMHEGSVVTDPAQVGPLIEELVDRDLEFLVRAAMLET